MSILKNKFTILILGIIVVLVFGTQSVFAQTKPSLIVSPARLIKGVGSSFILTIKVNPSGEKVCAVEGRLALSKLVVQKINMASGVISQTPPSFSNGLYFLLGIPGCVTQEKALFTVKVKANAVGQASASFKKVDIIGEGKSVSSDFISGGYKIIIPTEQSTAQKSSVSQTSACVCENWTSWKDEKCGDNGCLETQMSQTRSRTCVPSGCDAERQNQCLNNATCIASAKEPKVSEPTNSSKSPFLAAISSIINFKSKRSLVAILFGLILVLLILLYFVRRKRLVKNTKNNSENKN